MNDEPPLQGLVDALSKVSQQERAKYHLTLGELIDFLEDVEDVSKEVVFPDEGLSPHWPHSYRGYYADLGLEPTIDTVTVKVLLGKLKDTRGDTLTGYKGGEFLMEDNTPLWKSEWGGSSDDRPIMDVEETEGEIVLKLGEKDF